MQNLPMSPIYDPALVQPMRDEITAAGVEELLTADQVDRALVKEGTTLLFINSVCGCSAGSARPALRIALEHENRPDNAVSVFAGMEREAVERARSEVLGYPPSSPMFVLFEDGKVVHAIPRHHIEGHTAEQVAQNLKKAFDTFCREEA